VFITFVAKNLIITKKQTKQTMKFSKLIFTLFFAATIVNANAQDAKATQILSNLSAKAKAYKSITAEFSFILEDAKSNTNKTQAGSAKIVGKKFNLNLGDNNIISDGITQWTYNKKDNEVYIDNAGEGGEGAIDPSKLFTIWETGFKQFYDSEVTEVGVTLDVIKLTPLKPADKSYHTIKLYIDKAKNMVNKVKVMGKDGTNYTYSIKTFSTDKVYTDADFKFNKAKYAGVEEIDNR
jgi:outer membrane lipoprotein-sorting protein